MSDLINNIELELQTEKKQQFIFKLVIGLIIIGVAVLIGAASYATFNYYKSSQIEEEGLKFFALSMKMQKNRNDLKIMNSYIKEMEDIAKGSSAYALLAQHTIATTAITSGNFSKAINIYKNIANNKSYTLELRNLASLKLSHVRLMDERIGIEEKNIVSQELAQTFPVSNIKSPFSQNALLLQASIKKSEGKVAEAVELLQPLLSNSSEQTIDIVSKAMLDFIKNPETTQAPSTDKVQTSNSPSASSSVK